MAFLKAPSSGLAASANRRRIASLFAGAVTLLWALDVAYGQARGPGAAGEYAVKAVYLFKFAPFVDWPPQAFQGPAAPFTICVSGEDPFGSALDNAVQGQALAGRRVQVRRLRQVLGAPACQILFVGRSAVQSQAEILALSQGAPVLTVTDGGQPPGIISFVIADGRVRFAIDAARARAAGLTISSKLLALAVPLHPAA